MSVIVNIKQRNIGKKKISFKKFEELLDKHNFSYGISNTIYVTENYNGKNNIKEKYFVVYSNNYGRGFTFYLDKKDNVELSLNIPATKNDIKEFYEFTETICDYFKTNKFIQDGVEENLSKITELIEKMEVFSENTLVHFCKEMDSITIFSCTYPIVFETDKVKEILENDHKLDIFEKYIQEKSKMDCYYAKPIVYKDKEENYFAMYAITQDCTTIIPIKAEIPFGYSLPKGIEITSYNVNIGRLNGENYDTVTELAFEEFQNKLNFEKLEKFDEKHVILRLDKDNVTKLEQESNNIKTQ
jgi:hypothetical protein